MNEKVVAGALHHFVSKLHGKNAFRLPERCKI